jgi:hypothetical protein
MENGVATAQNAPHLGRILTLRDLIFYTVVEPHVET